MSAITVSKVRTFVPMLADWLGRWWMFAAAGVATLLIFNAFFMIGVNVTESLPQRIFLVLKTDHDIKPGHYAAFRWTGSKPYPAGSIFVKLVAGSAGDTVELEGRSFFVNGEAVGTAKPVGGVGNMAGVPLELGPTGVIPPGSFYVRGIHKDSLDSRYALMGWLPQEKVIGRAIPLF